MPTSGTAIPFRDSGAAARDLARLKAKLAPAVEGRLMALLGRSADPDSALRYLVRLEDEQPAAFLQLARSPARLQMLVTVFSASRFLSEEVLRHPEWVMNLAQPGDLYRPLSAEEHRARLEARLARFASGEVPAEEFALFRREQLLRIVIRDLLGYAPLAEVTKELSGLADAILEVALERIRARHEARHGRPLVEPDAGGRTRECGLSIIALGKLGASELNYSSDIDLMYVYEANGETAGPDRISNKEFFKKVCVQLTGTLSGHTAHGLCYRVDLRLRPEGRLGEICIALDAARSYYQRRARDWELQMLIKARVAAGDREPGRQLLEAVEPLIYCSSLDFSKVEAVSEARLRIHEKLTRRRGAKAEFDIKLAPGGIRDVEFLVQCLQRLHGGKDPWVRQGDTLMALFRLHEKELLSETEYSRLASAYQFLRTVEHRLQFLDDRQTHLLPEDEDELDMLARRLPPSQAGNRASGRAIREELYKHLAAVREIYERVVHMRLPIHYSAEREAAAPAPFDAEAALAARALEPVSVNLGLLLAQRAPGLAATLARGHLRYGARAFEHFLERIVPTQAWLALLNDNPTLTSQLVDIFEHSPYFSEQFIRKPELIAELRHMREQTEDSPLPDYSGELMVEPGELRLFFNRELLRLQCESICLSANIFTTLRHTSNLADFAINAAYPMALEQALRTHPPLSRDYEPSRQMTVIALGRLGMLEFDLASDADLVFVIPDEDLPELHFWTKVAERLIEILTAYTGDGVLFAVDTRLRPNGSSGPLVQTESAYRDYFSRSAQAWEGITYMKSRAVAGDVERGTAFLSALQRVDWRRYGQVGRSKEQLRQMRMRLEQEQGGANPLKAGCGGFYDIDFILMYLRLKGAGMFFKVLNTPKRIEVIEEMGHLDRAEAQFLLDAATFYRSVDHALRLASGHAEGRLPAAQLQLQMITDLVGRWTPHHLHDQPLPDELRQIQDRTREFFDRVFH